MQLVLNEMSRTDARVTYTMISQIVGGLSTQVMFFAINYDRNGYSEDYDFGTTNFYLGRSIRILTQIP